MPPPALPKPDWIRVRCANPPDLVPTRQRLHRHALHTVCESAHCPNLNACWAKGHATVMILGDRCTRNCRFCGVQTEPPQPPDPGEPLRVARAVAEAGLSTVVLTSVTRDDLPDGGAEHWSQTLRAVRDAAPGVTVEALIPDFGGSIEALRVVADAQPDILGHNLETVPRLYPVIRRQADYTRSLTVLRRASRWGFHTKTSLMLGFGETADEVLATLRDARDAGVRIAFLGQYLQPTPDHAPVALYWPPGAFDDLRRKARELGFDTVRAAPLLRSSTPPGVVDDDPAT